MFIWKRKDKNSRYLDLMLMSPELFDKGKFRKLFAEFKNAAKPNETPNKTLLSSLEELCNKPETFTFYFKPPKSNLRGGYTGLNRWCVTDRSISDAIRTAACEIWKFLFNEQAIPLSYPLSSGKGSQLKVDEKVLDEWYKRISRRQAERDKILTFDPEFYGKKTGKRQSIFEYETYHGLVVSALEKKYKNKHDTKQYTIFNTNLIDLGLQVDGNTRHIFEVKSSSDRQSIYAGIGQLMFHSLGSASVKKTLVLPSGKSSKKLIEVLNQLGIDLLFYEINNGEVKFIT